MNESQKESLLKKTFWLSMSLIMCLSVLVLALIVIIALNKYLTIGIETSACKLCKVGGSRLLPHKEIERMSDINSETPEEDDEESENDYDAIMRDYMNNEDQEDFTYEYDYEDTGDKIEEINKKLHDAMRIEQEMNGDTIYF